MNSKLIATMALALVIASPALAADACNVPADKAQSKDTLKAQLETAGWTVKQIKDNQGCYEVYASKADGTRMEKLFDPATLEMLDVEAD
jgi:hypothetical protein